MIGVVNIALILFIFRYEPIAYCVSKGKDLEDEAKNHMRKVYRKREPTTV